MNQKVALLVVDKPAFASSKKVFLDHGIVHDGNTFVFVEPQQSLSVGRSHTVVAEDDHGK